MTSRRGKARHQERGHRLLPTRKAPRGRGGYDSAATILDVRKGSFAKDGERSVVVLEVLVTTSNRERVYTRSRCRLISATVSFRVRASAVRW